ncbi:class I SAM-dependent methyltransferase, partial [Francisellaceae bacterium]|nr:class I SAM-dependent methyltransferase [Francisellaceae bacterium]
ALSMELITQAAVSATTKIHNVLDIGCGAGNNVIKLTQEVGKDFNVDLVDLSHPMLDRAKERIQKVNKGTITTYKGDIREILLDKEKYDVITAAAVLHHLRDHNDWETTFSKIYTLLAKGGSFWITDLVTHEITSNQNLMWQRYGDYLVTLGGEAYRDKVFEYIEKEDSPRPLTYQLDLLRKVGFKQVDVLHKNSSFAAFGAIK